MSYFIDPKKISKFCSDTIKGYCVNQPEEVFIDQDETSKNRYFLQGGRKDIAIGVYNKKMPIVLLQSGYWIHFSLHFEGFPKQKNKFIIKNISLQLFSSVDKKLLFRAEWDNKESLENSHPQPHWHIHPERELILENEAVNIKSFNEFLEIQTKSGFVEDIENKSITKSKIGDFHFAMASKWHIDIDDSSIIPLTEIHLRNWLQGCLKSISFQIEKTLN